MKQCQYCGSNFDSSLHYCPNCGATVFESHTEKLDKNLLLISILIGAVVALGTFVLLNVSKGSQSGTKISVQQNTQSSTAVVSNASHTVVQENVNANNTLKEQNTPVVRSNIDSNTEAPHKNVSVKNAPDIDSNADYSKGNNLYNAKNYAEAKLYFESAAEKGHATAMKRLGVMYKYGIGVNKDDYKAFEWYSKAAEKGEKDAMNRLGAMYKYGWGTSVNNDEAVKWFALAAENGNTTAMYNLGTMYHSGKGVLQDINRAIYWYQKAAEAGEENAVKALQRIKRY